MRHGVMSSQWVFVLAVVLAVQGCTLDTGPGTQQGGADPVASTRDVRAAGPVDDLRCDRVIQSTTRLLPGESGSRETESWSCLLNPTDAGGQIGVELRLEGLPAQLVESHGEALAWGTRTLRLTGEVTAKGTFRVTGAPQAR